MKALHFRFYTVLTGIVLMTIPLLCLVSVVSDAEIEMQARRIQGPSIQSSSGYCGHCMK